MFFFFNLIQVNKVGTLGANNKGKRAMPEMEKPLVDDSSLAAGESTKGSNAVKHGERIARLGDCKKRSRQMADHLLKTSDNAHHFKMGNQVASCANYLVFNHYYTIDQIKLAKARTCKRHLLCPFCARARAAKMVEKYLERFDIVMSENKNLIPVFVTLTVKNGDDLEERFKHLVTSFRKYQEHRRGWKKKGRGFNELCKSEGGVFSYEVTNKGNGWHPHLHAVLLVNDFIDQKQLSDEWEKITADSYIVDVRKLKPKGGDMAEAFCEVFKYALKFSELSLPQNVQAYDVLNGKRLQGAYGAFWGVKVPDTLTDELYPDLPYLELFYRFKRHSGVYDLTECKKRDPEPQAKESRLIELVPDKAQPSAQRSDPHTLINNKNIAPPPD